MRSPAVAEADAFWLKAETKVLPSRWAVGLTISGTATAPVGIDVLRAHVASRSIGIPWLRWRIEGRGRRPARYRWVQEPSLPVKELVVSTELAPGESLSDRIGLLVTEELSHDLPLWRIRLVEGEVDQALIVDGHHAFAGGFTLIEILAALFGEVPRSAPANPVTLPTEVDSRTQLTDAGLNLAAQLRRMAVRLLPDDSWDPPLSGPPLVGAISERRRVVTRSIPMPLIEAARDVHGAGVTRLVTALVSRSLDRLTSHETGTVRALFPHGTQEGPVTGPGNASRSTFLELPLHLVPHDRMTALKAAFAANSTAGRHPPAVADVVLSFQPATPDLWLGPHPLTEMTTSAPLRVCSRPLTRLTVIVQSYRDAIHVTYTADEASLGSVLDDVADDLVAAVDEFSRGPTRRRT